MYDTRVLVPVFFLLVVVLTTKGDSARGLMSSGLSFAVVISRLSLPGHRSPLRLFLSNQPHPTENASHNPGGFPQEEGTLRRSKPRAGFSCHSIPLGRRGTLSIHVHLISPSFVSLPESKEARARYCSKNSTPAPLRPILDHLERRAVALDVTPRW